MPDICKTGFIKVKIRRLVIEIKENRGGEWQKEVNAIVIVDMYMM